MALGGGTLSSYAMCVALPATWDCGARSAGEVAASPVSAPYGGVCCSSECHCSEDFPMARPINDVLDSSREIDTALREIPGEQCTLRKDMTGVREDQEEIRLNMESLMKRIHRIQERRQRWKDTQKDQ
mmetsp:Transcript_34536/g.103227  ORF Transcript_34536/g.103227 Transcript_34536/m.103227 type:complete len:128 (-) Transcript_34536:425-808(-)